MNYSYLIISHYKIADRPDFLAPWPFQSSLSRVPGTPECPLDPRLLPVWSALRTRRRHVRMDLFSLKFRDGVRTRAKLRSVLVGQRILGREMMMWMKWREQ